MNYRWTTDDHFPDDTDLEVQDEGGSWRIIAFIRWNSHLRLYRCRFMDMGDGEYPDGTTFKTKRGAKNFCERHLPVMWIRHCAKQGEKA